MWLVISQAALTVLVVGLAVLGYRFLASVRRDISAAQADVSSTRADIAANRGRIEESISDSIRSGNTIQQTMNQLDGRFQALKEFVKDHGEQESSRCKAALVEQRSDVAEKMAAMGRSFDDKIIELSREMATNESDIYKRMSTIEGNMKSQSESEKRAENNRPRSRSWSAHASAASEGALQDTSA